MSNTTPKPPDTPTEYELSRDEAADRYATDSAHPKHIGVQANLCVGFKRGADWAHKRAEADLEKAVNLLRGLLEYSDWVCRKNRLSMADCSPDIGTDEQGSDLGADVLMFGDYDIRLFIENYWSGNKENKTAEGYEKILEKHGRKPATLYHGLDREKSDKPQWIELRDALHESREREKRLRGALEFYANPEVWGNGLACIDPCDTYLDFDNNGVLRGGKRARQALTENPNQKENK